ILPEGSRVTKGQLVCELDSTTLKDHLANQVVEVKKAEAAFEAARLAREIAEVAVREYVEEVFPKESRAVSNEIALARSSITIAEERLKRTQPARDRLNALRVATTPAEILAALDVEDRLAVAEQALVQQRRALDIGQSKRDLLERFTKDKT